MIKLFEKQNKTFYRIAKDTNISERNLYRYADTLKIPLEDLVELANYFEMDVGVLVREIWNYRGVKCDKQSRSPKEKKRIKTCN